MIELKKVFLNIKADNFQDMIKQVSKKLLVENYINNDFETSIIKREKSYPTGLHFENIDVAIPHTDPEFVNKSGVIAVILQDPIEMIHMATTDKKLQIKHFFILLVKEGKLQMGLLTDLMQKFNDKVFVSKIKKANTKEELKDIFNS